MKLDELRKQYSAASAQNRAAAVKERAKMVRAASASTSQVSEPLKVRSEEAKPMTWMFARLAETRWSDVRATISKTAREKQGWPGGTLVKTAPALEDRLPVPDGRVHIWLQWGATRRDVSHYQRGPNREYTIPPYPAS